MFAHILIVIIVAIAITAFAERRNFQPVLLVAMVGLLASFVPGMPRLELEPEIILSVVLPPMLFSAARDFSFAEFTRRMGSITNLGVFLVFVTTVVVGMASVIVVPGMAPLAALVLGAVVAPPDAVTAIAIGRRSALPVALMTVLKGESLINDAAALTLFAVLVATASGTHAFIDNIILYFLYAAALGIVLGILLGHVAQLARRRLGNPSLATAVSIIVPFAAYLLAEELHASGVLAVVAAGFSMGHHNVQSGYAERMQETQFWRSLDTLLETFVFAYIGLQLRFVITDANEAGFELLPLLGAATAILMVITLVRFAWIFGSSVIARRRHASLLRKLNDPEQWARFEARFSKRGRQVRQDQVIKLQQRPLTWKENLVLSWTGMRGVVTLAAAAGVPVLTASGADFPDREAIVALAFLVTIGTLLLQGLTLPWLIGRLDVSDPGDASFQAEQHEMATRLAHAATTEALDAYRATHPSPDSQRLVHLMAQRSQQAASPEAKDQPKRGFDPGETLKLGRLLLEARRSRLIAARDAGELDDTIVREMLEGMDLEQAFMDTWDSSGD
ncbi:MAG: sodium:proton antiporter [Devosia sp.]